MTATQCLRSMTVIVVMDATRQIDGNREGKDLSGTRNVRGFGNHPALTPTRIPFLHKIIGSDDSKQPKSFKMQQYFDSIASNDPTITEVLLDGDPSFLALSDVEKKVAGKSFATNTHVKKVKMNRLVLDDSFATELSKSLLSNTSIRILDLDYNHISGAGIIAIISSLSLPTNQMIELQIRHQSVLLDPSDERELPSLLNPNNKIVKLGVDLSLDMIKIQVDMKLLTNKSIRRRCSVARRLERRKKKNKKKVASNDIISPLPETTTVQTNNENPNAPSQLATIHTPETKRKSALKTTKLDTRRSSFALGVESGNSLRSASVTEADFEESTESVRTIDKELSLSMAGITIDENFRLDSIRDTDIESETEEESSEEEEETMVDDAEDELNVRVSIFRNQVNAPFKSKFDAKDMRCLALVAHNFMKPAMKHFIASHSEVIKKFRLVGTNTTMSVCRSLFGENNPDVLYGPACTSGPLGGDAQLCALMCMEDVGGIIFFIDPLSAHPHTADIDSLIRLANVHNIFFCTNPATAMSMMYVLRCALTEGRKEKVLSFFQTLESPSVPAYKAAQKVALNKAISSKK